MIFWARDKYKIFLLWRLIMPESKIKDTKNKIKQIYNKDDKPWIVGYSGGKDSSTTAQLIFESLYELKKNGQKPHKDVYIVSADTLVENPMIIDFIKDTLNKIQTRAKYFDLPIKTKIVKPNIKETFWSLLIGRGYPSPRQKFRWCTDRLKIKPTNEFIKSQISKEGEVIVVLGVRKGESASRDQVLQNSKLEGYELRHHQSLNNAYIFTPIENFDVEDVWHYLLQYENEKLMDSEGYSPWGTNNLELYKLYKDSDAECPMTINKKADACGKSRFGCWVCTVVQEDKSLKGFIESGEKWMKPLLEFRNWIYDIRDDRDRREKKRRNGNVYKIKRNGEEVKGLGPFTLETRREILKKLLELQKKLNEKLGFQVELIKPDELKTIRAEWIKSGDLEDSLPDIYKRVFEEPLPWEIDKNYLFEEEERELL